MDHILHIFRKDGRRHWPEILASLVLLALYAHLNVHPWQKPDYRSFLFGRLFSLKSSVTPVLLLFWSFMIVRVVQSETLVGDRQWWITKPYDWWKLLFAKLFFVVVVILLPLFFVQLYLLHGAGFSFFRNLGGILGTEFALSVVLFAPSFSLAALSKGLGQAFLGLVAIFLGAWAIYWVTDNAPSGNMSNFADTPQSIQTVLLVCAIIVATLFQFARRKIWSSRGLIMGTFSAVLLIGHFTPYGKYVERAYPLVSNPPARISLRQPNESIGGHTPFDFSDNISLLIPLKVSGVAKNSVVLVDGMTLALKTSDGTQWSRGWFNQWLQIWSEDERESLSYQMKRKDYEKLKGSTVQVQIQLALREYREADVTEVVATGSPFRDPRLGLCRLGTFRTSSVGTVECLKPIRSPGLMATFDPKQAQCYVADEDYAGPELTPVHAWLGPGDNGIPDPGVSPLQEYSIYFSQSKPWVPREDSSGRSTPVRLCSGTRIRLARPAEAQRFRLKLQLDNVPFDALVAGGF